MLEAVADQRLWIWHAYFGVPGANNDLNVLYGSPLFDDEIADIAPECPFIINGHTYRKCYYLADGIYQKWSTFVKTFSVTRDAKTFKFKIVQEAARKDIERTFESYKVKMNSFSAHLALSSSIITGEYEAQEAPPSFNSGENSRFTGYSQEHIVQDKSYVVADPIPSFSSVQPRLENSITGDNRGLSTTELSAQAALSISAMLRGNASQPGLNDYYSDQQQAPPSYTDVRANSADSDQMDYVGVSLVRRRFKQVNPMAHYVEKY
ncbi:hypothetical protein Tco_0178489 [Tanacetum coccineum]